MKIIPDVLVLVRFILGPILFFAIKKSMFVSSLFILGLAVLTDAIDGTLARKFQVANGRGAHLDSLADGSLVSWVWLGFSEIGYLPFWSMLICFSYMMSAYILEAYVFKFIPRWLAILISLKPILYIVSMFVFSFLLILNVNSVLGFFIFGLACLILLIFKRKRFLFLFSFLFFKEKEGRYK